MAPVIRLVLASASPARLATLRAAGLDPEVIVSGVDEDSVRATSTARLVRALAEIKARAVAMTIRADLDAQAVVIGADSLLELDGQSLGKPESRQVARARWQVLSGRTATLHTGHALLHLRTGEVVQDHSETASTMVRFAEVTAAEIESYLATGEPLAVAGAFTIDGLGGWFVEAVDGDHHNVVGLSLPLVRRMLRELGLSLADVGYPASAPGPNR